METRKLIKVWDLPIRIFHWLLVVGFFVAYLTEDVIRPSMFGLVIWCLAYSSSDYSGDLSVTITHVFPTFYAVQQSPSTMLRMQSRENLNVISAIIRREQP